MMKSVDASFIIRLITSYDQLLTIHLFKDILTRLKTSRLR